MGSRPDRGHRGTRSNKGPDPTGDIGTRSTREVTTRPGTSGSVVPLWVPGFEVRTGSWSNRERRSPKSGKSPRSGQGDGPTGVTGLRGLTELWTDRPWSSESEVRPGHWGLRSGRKHLDQRSRRSRSPVVSTWVGGRSGTSDPWVRRGHGPTRKCWGLKSDRVRLGRTSGRGRDLTVGNWGHGPAGTVRTRGLVESRTTGYIGVQSPGGVVVHLWG